MRFKSLFGQWLSLVVGVACLIAAGVLGVHAIQQATVLSAYHHAGACGASAPSSVTCLHAVDGSVAAVTEFPGSGRISADYALDVRTASTTPHLTFSSDSPMLGYAADGDPAVVTMWRGVPVSVVTDGRSEATTSVPDTALAGDLGGSEASGGVGMFFVLAGLAVRRNRRMGGRQPLTSPVLAAGVWALGLGGFILAIGGFALGGKPSRLAPDLAATGVGLLVVLCLSGWIAVSVKRRASASAANIIRARGMPDYAHDLPILPPTSSARPATTRRMRMDRASWARMLAAVTILLPMLLTVAVVFGIFFTSQDGPPARAFRHAPACNGEWNLATCVGDFPAVINGVRAPANGANGADVSYVTPDGAINTWATFGGNTAAIVRMAVRTSQPGPRSRSGCGAAQSSAQNSAAAGSGPGMNLQATQSPPCSLPSASRCCCSWCGCTSTAGQARVRTVGGSSLTTSARL